MARKPASRSTAASSTTFQHLTNTATFSAHLPDHTPPYSTSATIVAGVPAPASSPLAPSAPSAHAMHKRSQPRSKNHGRFPCSIPGCFAVANHLSSMCRHKWGHLPQRLLPACRGHLPSGAACAVRYQGRADTMKRHWLTHHTNEGPWVPDRYPPFEDLWRLVQEGEIVLSPPSKYAYDSPGPESSSTASATARTGGGGDASSAGTRRNSVGISAKTHSHSKVADVSAREELSGRSRSHSFGGGPTRHPGARDVRFSRGNTKPWRISDPTQDMLEDEEEEELDELDAGTVDGDMDIEMEHAISDASCSPSRHSYHSLRHSPAYPHSTRSQRSPRSPASIRSFPADHEQADVDIHVPYATIPPITPRMSAPNEPVIMRYPLHPVSNYPVLQPSNFREHAITYNNSYLRHHGHTKSKDSGVIGLLALSTSREFLALENVNPGARTLGPQPIKPNHGSIGITGAYVYGHGKGTPPGPAYTPASIPHSELSLLSHPPTDRILPSSPSHTTDELPPMQDLSGVVDAPYPPMRVTPESELQPLPHSAYEMWQTHEKSLMRPFTVASH